MTDKEIIKALESEIHLVEYADSSYADNVSLELLKNALALINRQQAEIERLKTRQNPTAASGYKLENGKVVFYTHLLAGYRHEYESLEQVVGQLNALLRNCYDKDEIASHLEYITKKLKTARAEAIKEFAENLKYDWFRGFNAYGIGAIHARIDAAVKEMVGAE